MYHIWLNASLCTNIYLSINISFNKLLTLNDLVLLFAQVLERLIKYVGIPFSVWRTKYTETTQRNH